MDFHGRGVPEAFIVDSRECEFGSPPPVLAHFHFHGCGPGFSLIAFSLLVPINAERSAQFCPRFNLRYAASCSRRRIADTLCRLDVDQLPSSARLPVQALLDPGLPCLKVEVALRDTAEDKDAGEGQIPAPAGPLSTVFSPFPL